MRIWFAHVVIYTSRILFGLVIYLFSAGIILVEKNNLNSSVLFRKSINFKIFYVNKYLCHQNICVCCGNYYI